MEVDELSGQGGECGGWAGALGYSRAKQQQNPISRELTPINANFNEQSQASGVPY